MIVHRGPDSEPEAEDVVQGAACQQALDDWENDGGCAAPKGKGRRHLEQGANRTAGPEYELRIAVTLSTKDV
jgi:hypothetical protein